MAAPNSHRFPTKPHSPPRNDAQLAFPGNFVTPIPPARYDAKGRVTQYQETAVQRRERLEFLHRREWAERVSQWIRSTDGKAKAAFKGHSASSSIPSINESEEADEDDEPYVIYSVSPASSSSSLSLNSNGTSSSSTNSIRADGSNKSRRTLSLSSINEAPEED